MLIRKFKQSLRWRITILFSGLILVLFSTALFVVNTQNISNAEANIESDLRVTIGVFSRLIDSRTKSLRDIAKPATSDHAFRQVFSDGHTSTIVSAMNNIVSRLNGFSSANMLLVDYDGNVIASSQARYHAGSPNPWPWLIDRAEQNPRLESSGIVMINRRLYQMIVAPLLIPDPEAWVVFGFPIDDEFADEISKIALTDLSVHSKSSSGKYQLHASSLEPNIKADISAERDSLFATTGKLHRHKADGENYLSLNTELEKTPNDIVKLAIHGSFDKELEPYKRLNVALISIFGVGLAFSALGTVVISRSITGPISDLNASVAAIGEGDYSTRAKTDRHDEVGMLAYAVNGMAEGLEEKERVRNLLGRLVSNDVAEELLKNDIELGGEEKEVTVLFCDIRDFTSLSESMPPSELLNLLNRYFTRLTAIIESHHGVVDKYIGDEVMAVFGAPVENRNHAGQAVAAAREILQALSIFNREIEHELSTTLNIGIGINTGTAVAGNIGSQSRMNYTVIGDVVNTASRLEGLTKEFNTPLVVSSETALATPEVKWRDLGKAMVKGKSEKLRIYTPE